MNTDVEQPVALLATVLDEVKEIRADVLEAHRLGRLSRWDDADTNEEFLREVFAKHKKLGEGYPLVVRGIVYTEDFRIIAVQKFFKWVSKNPSTPAGYNSYYWRQAEYTYFDEVSRGIGRGKARKKSALAYDLLMEEDTEKRKRMDAAVATYKADEAAAIKIVTARLRKMAMASAQAEAPSEVVSLS